MADLLIGAAFQLERAALIKEIARNIAGTPAGPPLDTPVLPVATGTAAALASSTQAALAEAAWPGDAGLASDAAQPGPTALLLGLKLPQASQAGVSMFGAAADMLQTLDSTLKALASPMTELASGAADGAMAGGSGAAKNAVPSDPSATSETTDAIIALLKSTVMPEDEAGASLPKGLLSAGPQLEAQAETVDARSGAAEPAALDHTLQSREAGPLSTLARRDASQIGDARPTDLPAAAAARLEATESAVTRALMSLGGAEEMAAMPRALQAELGGIIASFILNAHFQPGWPPLRPIQDPEAKALVLQLAKDTPLSKDDIAMLTYLANFGLNKKQLLRILKLVATATNRLKILELLAELLSTMSALLGTVRSEIETLIEELRSRRRNDSRREHLSLR